MTNNINDELKEKAFSIAQDLEPEKSDEELEPLAREIYNDLLKREDDPTTMSFWEEQYFENERQDNNEEEEI